RKRNYGDNQSVLATRTWGLNSSARSLIYVDDILISNLQGNNNSNASPRWGLVAPEEIQRIDFLYGPFAAMYPGNSIGGVLQITTRRRRSRSGTSSRRKPFRPSTSTRPRAPSAPTRPAHRSATAGATFRCS